MSKLKVYFHPFLWLLKKHVGVKDNKYLLDIDAKPKWLYEYLKNERGISFKKAKPLSICDFYKVHDKRNVDAIFEGNPNEVGKYSWITWSRSFIRSQLHISGIIYDAINYAYLHKTIVGCLAIEGHHAKKNHGSGFCTFNHLMVALNKFISNKTINTLIIDLDCHLGDGMMQLIGGNPKIHVFDIYGKIHKGGINKKYDGQMLKNALNKREYFNYLELLDGYLNNIHPDLILFIAGVDLYQGDRYGGIPNFDIEDIKRRDDIVFKMCKKYRVPTVFTLGGGYIKYPDPDGVKKKNLLTLHKNTIFSSRKILSDSF